MIVKDVPPHMTIKELKVLCDLEDKRLKFERVSLKNDYLLSNLEDGCTIMAF